MYEQVEKAKENKSRAVTNSVVQKKSNVKQSFRFVDNRPEAIAQQRLKINQANISLAQQSLQCEKIGLGGGIQLKGYYHGRAINPEDKLFKQTPPDIKEMKSRENLDFDPKGKGGFYLGVNEGNAIRWAEDAAKKNRETAIKSRAITPSTKPQPIILEYDVPDEKINSLKSNHFKNVNGAMEDEEKKNWQDFVFNSRSGKNDHSYDVVSGPMLKNPRVLETDKQESIKLEPIKQAVANDQIALYTDEAKNLFNAHYEGTLETFPVDSEYQKLEKEIEEIARQKKEAGRKITDPDEIKKQREEAKKRKKAKKKVKIEDETPLTNEESRSIRQSIIDLQTKPPEEAPLELDGITLKIVDS